MTGLISTYDEAVAYLERHIGRGLVPGTGRISALLEMMGDPQTAYPIIHVAGTNGKTSTSRMATMLAVAHGLTTGTFTSPHLERIEERIGLNGYVATPDQFVRAVADVAAFADIYESRSGEELTYFELTAAMAFAWFADQAADAAVIEVGLGGRLDATNACRAQVAVLTEVGLEHQEYLGDTIEKIAAEKLAIVKQGSVLVTGPLQPSLIPIAERVAREKDARLLRYGSDFRIESSERAVGGWQLDITGVEGTYEDVHLPIHGRHQTLNLAVSVAAVEALLGGELDSEAVRDAASVMSSPGRLEPISSRPLVMLDGAHNPDGFGALAASLREEFPRMRWVLLTGAMADKDLVDMYPRLEGLVTSVVVTHADSPNALRSDVLGQRMTELLRASVESVDDPGAALARARELAGPDGNVLVTGSLYLVGAVRSLVTGDGSVQRNER
jgi:dihydrofolate synthase/folylpolyglutamate synthase